MGNNFVFVVPFLSHALGKISFAKPFNNIPHVVIGGGMGVGLYLTGGTKRQEERERAASYKQNAEAIDHLYPRLATTVREIAT
jgi:hypothetical protein